MNRYSILAAIKRLEKSVFTTREVADISGCSLSSATLALTRMEREGLMFRIYRGIWAETSNAKLSPYAIIPYLLSQNRAYVSFISALHLYGMIEQIPQEITLASIIHSKTIKTKIGTFAVHKLTPDFFKGFSWYKGSGTFLIADPEKALIDCLYISGHKNRQFRYFPELNIPKTFSIKKARSWANAIPHKRIQSYVLKKLKTI